MADESHGHRGPPRQRRHGWFPPPRHRPPWWPADEAWPPHDTDGSPIWAGRHAPWAPGRLMFRLGCLFVGLLLFAILGLGFAAMTVLGALGLVSSGGLPGQLGLGLAILGTVAGVVAIGLLVRGFRRIAGPLDELSDAAASVAAGDLAARVGEPSRGPRQLRDLVRAFNTMAERLELDEERRRALLADVSHELRTPLAVVAGGVEAMIDGVHPADAEHLGLVLEETRVMTRLVEDLRTIALAEAGTLGLNVEPTDVDVLIGDAIAGFRAAAAATAVTLTLRVPDDLPLAEVDPVRIREVLSNLVSNALHHTPTGGGIRVEADAVRDRSEIRISVADTGSGIGPEFLPHVFDRFTKGPSSRGSGLGLAIARDLVQAHGGTIAAESLPGVGTTIRVALPLERRPM